MRKFVSTIWGAPATPRIAATGSHRTATSIRRGPVFWLILLGALLIVTITIGTMLMVSEFRERALGNSERELENTVRLLARHFDQQLDDLEVPLDDLIARTRQAGVVSADDFRRQMSTPETHLLLKAKVSGPSEIAGINIYDAGGTLINSSEVAVVPSVNIADRDYYKALTSTPEPQQIELVRSRFSGGLRTVIARKVTGPDGQFLGVISRAVAPTKFESFFSSVALGKDAAISMFHRDGTMLARHPYVDSMIGRKFKTAPLIAKVLADGGQQTLRVHSPVDQQERLGSAAQLSHFPIVVVATTTVSAALADWRAQTRFLVVAAVLSALVIAVILLLIVRQMTLQGRESQARLEAEKHRLDTALNNMLQGLVLYDASARVVICNQRYLDMYRSVDGSGETRLPLSRPDPASQGHRILRRRCRRILLDRPEKRRAGQGHRPRPESRRRANCPDRQQAPGAGRLGRDHRGYHRAPKTRRGARPQLCVPAPDHRPHPDRRSRSRTPATAVTCWPTGWPRYSSRSRRTPSSARPLLNYSRSNWPSRSQLMTKGRCNPPTAWYCKSIPGKARSRAA